MKYLFAMISTLILAGCSSMIVDGGSRYKFVDNSVSWSEAKILAEEAGGHLATFSSSDELSKVESRLPAGSIYWIGLSDAAEEGVWRWIDGTPLPRGMLSNLSLGADRDARDFAHITLNGELGSRINSGALPKGFTGRNQVDGYLIEFD